MSMFASTARWLQRKRYQYEVTFSLYMMTPTEIIIFNTFIFLFISMIVIAASLYLPQHLSFLTKRAWFYYHGDAAEQHGSSAAAAATRSVIGMKEAVETVMKAKATPAGEL